MGFFRRRARQRQHVSSQQDAGPSEASDSAEVASLHGERLHADDVNSRLSDQDAYDAVDDSFNMSFILSVALIAVSAVYFTVQRILTAVGARGDSRRELHPRRAFVLRLNETPSRKPQDRPRMHSPDLNLTFVVPEDVKLQFAEAVKNREVWQKCLCFVPESCHVVDQLLRAGATCQGRAFTEPVPFNVVEGKDAFFRNPAVPGAMTGGEYSGCAVLVSAGLTDFAIALDTVGGARIAAACCGVIAFKPTHGSVLLHGISAKADALDSMTIMVKEPQYLSRIGEMMDLPSMPSWKHDVIRVYIAMDLFNDWIGLNGREMVLAISKAALNWAGPEQGEEVDLADFLSTHATGWQDFDPEDVYEALRRVATIIAGYELKCKILKDCDGTADEASEESRRYHEALEVRNCIQQAFRTGIRESKLVILPALMRPPPSRMATDAELRQFERETQKLQALFSLVGCPQLQFPIRNKSGNLYAVSLVSLNRTDKELLSIGEKLIPLTQQMLEAEIMAEEHKRQRADLHPLPHAAQRLSNAEMEGEKWKEIGNKCYKDAEFERAVVAYSEAIQQCPYNAVYYSNRAMANLKLMRYEFAEEDCSKALVIDSHNAKALWRRGMARKGMGLYIEAQEDFEKVLMIEPSNRQAKNELRDLERVFDQV